MFFTIKIRERGFTLVELLIVILILGILIAIALPTFLSQQDGAANVASQAAITNSMHSAKATYVAHQTVYPPEPILINDLQEAEPEYQYHSYLLTGPSTDTNHLSVSRDGSSEITICSKSDSDTVYCARSHEEGQLLIADAETSRPSILAALNPLQLLFPEAAVATDTSTTYSKCSGSDEADVRFCLASTLAPAHAVGDASPNW